MAIKVNAGDVKRGDFYFVDPNEIMVKEELRGRTRPPSDGEIVGMAESMLKHGQLQAVECRRVQDNRLLLTMGFTRTAAARLIRAGFEDSNGAFQQDAEFRLKVGITNSNDQDAFVHNIVENSHRKQTSPIDDAHNQERMRDRYGYKDADIARLYLCAPAKVSNYKKLLQLSEAAQSLVHGGRMSVQAAFDFLELPPDQQEEYIKNAQENGGKVKGSDVRAAVRDNQLGDGILNDDDKPSSDEEGGSTQTTSTTTTTQRYKPRSMRELRQFLESLDGPGTSDEVRKLVTTLNLWLQGRRKDKTLQKVFDDLCPKVKEAA